MDFSLTREQELIRKMIRAFTENEVKPIAAVIDRTHEFPAENIRKLFRLRVISMTAPREYGGAGSDQLSTAICAEGLRLHERHHGRAYALLRADSGARDGGAEAKVPANADNGRRPRRYGHHRAERGLRRVEIADAGASGGRPLRHQRLEDMFITNGSKAGVFVIFAMTDKSKGTKRLSAFIIESTFPGFSVGKIENKMGLHGVHTSEIVFTDRIVPKENLLGQEGKGFKICMQTLNVGRIGIAGNLGL